ncbi:hypothetical protein [Bacillus pinisoli]|uniref:hypothetical protein n=1 Tax=Bacillus pinisoli TaxID=2901866 RepID=UPI001FF6A1D7|nr:hypothetical protein [Bacillus pinisoli]
MRKWIVFLIVIIIISVWTTIDTYRSAHTYRNQITEKATATVKKQEPGLSVNEVSFYNGTKAYTIIYGTVDEQEQIFCVPSEQEDEIIVVNPKKGITANEAINILKNDRNPVEIKSINLGIEQNVPIWEIIYVDQKNRYSYYYVTFKDGEFIKRYTL